MRSLYPLLFCFALSACANLQIYRNDAVKVETSSVEVEMHSFLWGFIPGKKLPSLTVLCPKGRLESATLGMTGNNVLLTAVTFGAYVPHRVSVRCAL